MAQRKTVEGGVALATNGRFIIVLIGVAFGGGYLP